MTPYMLTHSGRKLDLIDPDLADIHINDIAHGLSQVNRFCGQTEEPISVAQHSVLVARLCEPCGHKIILQALLHDASEAYLGDVTKWLKEDPIMREYRIAERILQGVIYDKFKIDPVLAREVKEADKLAVRYEAELGYKDKWMPPEGYPLLSREEKLRIREVVGLPEFWSPHRSKATFLQYWEKVTNYPDLFPDRRGFTN